MFFINFKLWLPFIERFLHFTDIETVELILVVVWLMLCVVSAVVGDKEEAGATFA